MGYSAGSRDYQWWVGQVRIVAILSVIEGVLEFLMGLLYVSCAIMLPLLLQRASPPPGAGNSPAVAFGPIIAMYSVMGVPVLLCGGLRLFAAIRNYQYRSRTLGIISAVAGIASLLSCYCAPTAIGLAIYALIVLLHPAVKVAFELGQQGHTAEQIRGALYSYGAPVDSGQSPFGNQ